jgi:hypothetical protein
MTYQTVFFDEAGNTGAALTDPAQPVFVLASTDLDDQEADELVAPLLNQQAKEAKFSSLRKTGSGRRKLVELIASESLNSKRVKTLVTHKRYMIMGKIVDLIEEPLMHASGIDLYKEGANIALCNMHYAVSPVFCGSAKFDEFLASFVEMVRRPSRDTKARFFAAVTAMHDNCKNVEHKSSFTPYLLAERHIDQLLDGVGFDALDPAIPSFFALCTTWGAQIGAHFHVVHDASKPIAANKETFEAMMDPSIESAVIGYDRRMFEFPLKATGVTFADSARHSALQLADLVAGATAYWASAMAGGEKDQLATDLEAAGVRRFVFDAIWPSLDVTPEALGTDKEGGVDALEHIVKVLSGRQDKSDRS